MINKIKGFMKSNAAKLSALSLAIVGGAMAFGISVHAAVDADVASTTASLSTTLKENVFGAITANIGTIVLIGALILGIGIIWKLVKRFTGR